MGHFTLRSPGELSGSVCLELEAIVESLLPPWPVIVAYERPLVLHPRAAQFLAGLAWTVEFMCAKRGIMTMPIPNTSAKHHFAGRTYSKKDKPYPGITEARRRGIRAETTDEADAVALFFYASHKIETGHIRLEAP